MKSFLILFSCILLLFTACKKHTDVTQAANTMSIEVDGVEENFSARPYAQLTSTSSLTIAGGSQMAGYLDVLSIELFTNQPITTGTYTSGTADFLSMSYNNATPTPENLNTYSTDVNGSPSTLTITKLTSTNIQGTFAGKLVYKGASKNITNGKFNINLVK